MLNVSAVMLTHNSEEYIIHTLPPLVSVCREVIVLDMESTDKTIGACSQVLGGRDLILQYNRRNLFTFGFGHARNYASKFASSDWIFAVDSDEWVDADELVAAFEARQAEPSVFDVQRRNYERRAGLSLDVAPSILREATYSVERHRRLYRRDPTIRFEGLIHEEVWEGFASAYATCGSMDVTLHHLSAYGAQNGEKHELYAYLLIKAQVFPNFRYGTNSWFFQHYVPDNVDALLASANVFASRHNLSRFEREEVKLR